MADIQSLHASDPTQLLVPVTVNNRIRLAVINTDAYKTIMYKEMAKAYEMKEHMIQGRDCSKFGMPGSGVVHDYACHVEALFKLSLSDKVRFLVGGMRSISHPFPMMLLDADIL